MTADGIVRVLYSFIGDGASPDATLVEVVPGTLYGTTTQSYFGWGIVFRLTMR